VLWSCLSRDYERRLWRCTKFRFTDVRWWPYAAEFLVFQFSDVRLRPRVTVGIAIGVAKEIGRTSFPELRGAVRGSANHAWRRNYFFSFCKCCDRWNPRAWTFRVFWWAARVSMPAP
jgi:hypothetical protein